MEDKYSKYHLVPQPEEISQTEKEDAMGSYLMMFAAFAVGLPLPIINLIAAFVYYILNRKKSRFIKFHCLQSLLSQLPTTVLNAVLLFWTIRLFIFKIDNIDTAFGNNTYFGYIIVVVIANLIYIIFSIVGAVKANKGQFYYFVFFGPLAFHYTFLKTDDENKTIVNRPPNI
jgi:uncharacterized Tic20 family protein